MTPTGNDELRSLDDLITRGEALIEARRNPADGAKTFPDFGEAYRGWYIAGEDLLAALAGPSSAKDWTARWCRGMHSLAGPDAARWLKEHERQQAMLLALRRRFASNLPDGVKPAAASEPGTAAHPPKGVARLYDVRASPPKLLDDQLLADLRRVARASGKETVTIFVYRRMGKFGESVFMTRFGTWNKALNAAGLKSSKRKDIPNLELFENLARVQRAVGRPPVQTDMFKPQSEFSTRPYTDRFGSWLRALKEFAAWTRDGTMRPEAKVEPKAPRAPSANLRYAVLRRDFHKCTACGRSPATDPGVVLHVDHKIPWSRGGKTTLDNLTTLCQKCNLGKGDG